MRQRLINRTSFKNTLNAVNCSHANIRVSLQNLTRSFFRFKGFGGNTQNFTKHDIAVSKTLGILLRPLLTASEISGLAIR